MSELFTDEDIEVTDRSTLQPHADCPRQGWFLEHQKVPNQGELMDVGNEVHRIVADAVKARQTNGEPAFSLKEKMTIAADESRPDIQPQVVRVVRRAAFAIARILCFDESTGIPRHSNDLLRYDGGEVETGDDFTFDHSGQIAADILIGEHTERLTCELDLLMATASVEELELWDWKSGWKNWTATEVRDSFQFQFYTLLIFLVYPAVNRVRVRVFMCAEGEATSVIVFDRARDMFTIEKRIKAALKNRADYRNAENPEDVPAWPLPEKCINCAACVRCSAVKTDEVEVAIDPAKYLERFAIIEAARNKMQAALKMYVKGAGKDLELESGLAFGSNKPTSYRAPRMDLYHVPIPGLQENPNVSDGTSEAKEERNGNAPRKRHRKVAEADQGG